MEKDKFDFFRKLIAPGNQSAMHKDVKVFTQWASKEIETDEAIQRFLNNNKHTGERIKIKPKLFEQWLGSLGYKRKQYEEE